MDSNAEAEADYKCNANCASSGIFKESQSHVESSHESCNITKKSHPISVVIEESASINQATRPTKESPKSCKQKCNQCDARFKQHEELLIHQKMHYENNTFKCLMCDFVSFNWVEVKVHMQTHNKPDAHKCSDCDLSFASPTALKNHWRFQHLGGRHLCDECGLEASSKYMLFQHQMQHHGSLHFCPHCSFKCDNQIDLDNHVLCRHGSGYTCKYCDPQTSHLTRESLVTHMAEKHPGKKCFLCDTCNYVAKLRHHLDKHTLVHTGERPLKCKVPGCDYATKDQRNLKQHVVTKHSKPGDLICRQCHFVTTNQNEWDVHRAMHHMKVFQCQQCPYKANSSACLRRHRLAKHVSRDNMRYPCPHCAYRSNIRESFNKHLLTHVLRNSRHKCVVCKNSFGSREELLGHIEKEHPEDLARVRFCDKCTYSCTRAQAMQQHILTHSDEKSLKCNLCDYICRTHSALRAHTLRKHREDKAVAITSREKYVAGIHTTINMQKSPEKTIYFNK